MIKNNLVVERKIHNEEMGFAIKIYVESVLKGGKIYFIY